MAEYRAGDTATMERASTAPRVDRNPSARMPPWSVLLHNDDVNELDYVVRTVRQLTPLNAVDALQRTLEAHQRGLAQLFETHREHAELVQEQLTSRRLTVTIEPCR